MGNNVAIMDEIGRLFGFEPSGGHVGSRQTLTNVNDGHLDLGRFNPKGLLGPQIPHTIRLIDSIFYNGVAADLSETGVGKSYCASAVARHFNGPIVVVGPKTIIHKWKEILNSFGKEACVYINYEKLCRGGTQWLKYVKPPAPPEQVPSGPFPAMDLNNPLLLNGDQLEQAKSILLGLKKKKNRRFRPDETQQKYWNVELKFPPGSLVIIDEVHRCKGICSLQAGFLIALRRQGYKMLLLSATAATTPLDMRAFGYAVNLIPSPHMKEYKNFCIEAGAEWTGQFGALRFDDEDRKAKEKMASIHDYLFNVSKIASRLTRDEMGTLFPENEIIVESLDMGENSDRIQRAFEVMERELSKLDESTADYSGHVFAEIMKMRRRCEMLKIPTLAEMVEDLYDEKKSVIVCLNFTESIEALQKRLERLKKFKGKDLIALIYGERSIKQRIQDIADVQADKKLVTLMNLACAESIGLHDLHGNYSRALLMVPSFSAIKVLQGIGRHHRQGGLTKCLTKFILARRTYEDVIQARLNSRLDNIELLNTGDLTGNINFFRSVKGMDI